MSTTYKKFVPPSKVAFDESLERFFHNHRIKNVIVEGGRSIMIIRYHEDGTRSVQKGLKLLNQSKNFLSNDVDHLRHLIEALHLNEVFNGVVPDGACVVIESFVDEIDVYEGFSVYPGYTDLTLSVVHPSGHIDRYDYSV